MGIDRPTLRKLVCQTADRAIAGARQESAKREARLKQQIKKRRRELVMAAAESLRKFVSGTLKSKPHKSPLECKIAVSGASFKNEWFENDAIIMLPEDARIREAKKDLDGLESELMDTIEDHQTQRDGLLSFISTADNAQSADVNAAVQKYLKTGIGV